MSKLSRKKQKELAKFMHRNHNPNNLPYEKVLKLVASGGFDDFLEFLPDFTKPD